MKVISIILSAVIAATFSAGIALSEPSLVAPNETYLGAVTYQGGLMERGALQLTPPQNVRHLRIDIPSFCAGEIFEVGAVSDRSTVMATNVGNNTYSINHGRGFMAQSVFISINGPVSPGCSVLVFKVEQDQDPAPTPPSEPTQPQAFTCVVNALPFTATAHLYSAGWNLPVTITPNQTIMIFNHLLPNGLPPAASISFDADIGPIYFPVSVPLASVIQTRGNCATAPLYQFQYGLQVNRVDLVRVR